LRQYATKFCTPSWRMLQREQGVSNAQTALNVPGSANATRAQALNEREAGVGLNKSDGHFHQRRVTADRHDSPTATVADVTGTRDGASHWRDRSTHDAALRVTRGRAIDYRIRGSRVNSQSRDECGAGES
jgi:hypothetical protein